jgi:hypothetical protein
MYSTCIQMWFKCGGKKYLNFLKQVRFKLTELSFYLCRFEIKQTCQVKNGNLVRAILIYFNSFF